MANFAASGFIKDGKMKKKKLEVDYSYDFDLLGISSSAKGYKLAWEINRLMNINLVKQKDLILYQKKDTEISFSCFCYESVPNKLMLFRNKPNENERAKDFLVPEFPHMDYIFMTQGEEYTLNKRLQELLRNIPSIELVAFLPLAALKSKDNFIF
ncbi:MAG: IPExxxVDY family protein [Cytophaga sp.]|nr:IPExxxVDY family protein [Cytophaga sp.]